MTEEELAAQEAEKIQAQAKVDAELKLKYKWIRKAVNVDGSGNEHVAYFKAPSRTVLGIAMSTAPENILLACEYLFNECVIREISDWEYFFNDDAVFVGISGMLQGLIQQKKSIFSA